MPSILITGKPGEGKTHYAMKKIREAVKQGRTVYTNIDSCKLDVHPIPVNEFGEMDWQLTEEADAETGQKGALIVYDEAQRLTDNNDQRYFAWKNREKLSERAVIKEIEYHRHSGRDIIFITQSPKFLHLHLLELINEHYHCTRLRKEKRSQISLWRTWQEKPDSVAATERAEDIFFEKFDPEIFKLYKSTEDVTDGKARIPAYMYKLGLIAFICIGGAVSLLANLFNHFGDGHRIGQDSIDNVLKSEEKLKQSTPVVQTQGATVSIDQKKNLDIECRKGENVSKPECVEWFNNLTNSRGSVTSPTAQTVSVSYNPAKPFDQAIQESIVYQATAKPVFSGCMKKNGKYYGYTQQGTLLDVNQDDCRKVIENGDRPFNYFKQDIPVQAAQVQVDQKPEEKTEI